MKHYTQEDLRKYLIAYIEKYFKGNQSAFAEYCGVTDPHLSAAIHGKATMPKKVMNALGFEWAKRTAIRSKRHRE